MRGQARNSVVEVSTMSGLLNVLVYEHDSDSRIIVSHQPATVLATEHIPGIFPSCWNHIRNQSWHFVEELRQKGWSIICNACTPRGKTSFAGWLTCCTVLNSSTFSSHLNVSVAWQYCYSSWECQNEAPTCVSCLRIVQQTILYSSRASTVCTTYVQYKTVAGLRDQARVAPAVPANVNCKIPHVVNNIDLV